jgi:hypothetical protein
MKSREPTTIEPTGHASPLLRQNVTESAGGEVPRAHVEGDDRVEEPRAVDVKRHVPAVRHGADRLDVRQRQRLAVAGRVGIFERDHARDRVVDVVLTEGSLDLVEGKRPVRTLADGADSRPHEGGVPSGLVDDDVGLSAGNRLHPAAKVR